MRARFHAMLEGGEPPHLRRPTASLRLICDTQPPLKVVLHPDWICRRAVDPDRIDCELFQERITTVKGQGARKFDRLFPSSLPSAFFLLSTSKLPAGLSTLICMRSRIWVISADPSDLTALTFQVVSESCDIFVLTLLFGSFMLISNP